MWTCLGAALFCLAQCASFRRTLSLDSNFHRKCHPTWKSGAGGTLALRMVIFQWSFLFLYEINKRFYHFSETLTSPIMPYMCTDASIWHTNCFPFSCFLSPSILSFYLCVIFISKQFSTWHFLPKVLASQSHRLFMASQEELIIRWVLFATWLLSDTSINLTSKRYRCFVWYLWGRGCR